MLGILVLSILIKNFQQSNAKSALKRAPIFCVKVFAEKLTVIRLMSKKTWPRFFCSIILKWANLGLFLFIFGPKKYYFTKNCRLHWDLNSNRQIRRQAHWPLDWQHGPSRFDHFEKLTFVCHKLRVPQHSMCFYSVWPDKNCQMSIKVAEKWFH